jgi:hypothetical protein
VQGVEFEYAEKEGDEREDEEGCAGTENAVGCYCLRSELSVCSSDL